MFHRLKESVLQTIGTKRSSYENKEFQQRLEKYGVFIRSLEQVHESIVLYIEALDLTSNASVGLAESLCNFSMDVRLADQKEGAETPMNQVSLHFLKIQEDLAQVYKNQVRKILSEKCLRPIESILSLTAMVNEKEKVIKSSTLDCDHFKSKRESELLSGKLFDHPTVMKLTEQLKEAEKVVDKETRAVLNFFDRIDAHMPTLLGPETSVLVGSLQHSHASSSHLLSQLNDTLPQSASALCELSTLFEDQKQSLKSPRLVQEDAQPAVFPAVSSHVPFLNVDIFSPLQKREVSNEVTSNDVKSQSNSHTSSAPVKSGYLKKKNKLFWEERWFELEKPGVLSWYRKKNNPDPSAENGGSSTKEEMRNQINLQDVSGIDYMSPSNHFTINIEGGKSYDLFAGSEGLAAEWYEALMPWVKAYAETSGSNDKDEVTIGLNENQDGGGGTEMVSPPPPSSSSSSISGSTQSNTISDLPPPPKESPPPRPTKPRKSTSTDSGSG